MNLALWRLLYTAAGYLSASRTRCRQAEHVDRMGRVGIQVAMHNGMAGVKLNDEQLLRLRVIVAV